MKKNYVRYLILGFVFMFNYVFSIPTPPNPLGKGGAGGDGDADQAPDTPINMFVIPLLILAVMLIVHFARKRNTKLS